VPQGAVLLQPGTLLGPAEAGVLATVGKTEVTVSRKPRVVLIATGNELVPVNEVPEPHQLRMSNVYSLGASLEQMGIQATVVHLEDHAESMLHQLKPLIADTDVWISSGAVSAGKYDFLPQVLAQLGMQQIFHKVQQRPGKPFLFGTFSNGPVVFALPGNPVSGFMCFYRYVQPWLQAAMQMRPQQPQYAVLGAKVNFDPNLEYYLPVKLESQPHGKIVAVPQPYQGSGDLASLVLADAFMELPADQSVFKKGDSFPVWKFR
jgi:molybdopterin molybdotransferase